MNTACALLLLCALASATVGTPSPVPVSLGDNYLVPAGAHDLVQADTTDLVTAMAPPAQHAIAVISVPVPLTPEELAARNLMLAATHKRR